jgi:hypothetical protein
VARLSRRLGLAIAALAASLALAACGGGANASALDACKNVHRALLSYQRSLVAPSPEQARADVAQAVHDVAAAQGQAAMANSQDGSYDALMTLIQQAQELPFGNVAPALKAACDTITSPTGVI